MTRGGLLALVVLTVGLGTGTAQGNLWENIYYGLDVLATPLGGPLTGTGDGTRVNGSRSGRLRIVPSGLGGGYQLELDRTFGADSRGRYETLHLGGLGDVTLDGGIQATLGYDLKPIPIARGSFVASGLSYNLRSKVGVQDAQLFGTLDASSTFDINPLGFYSLNLNISNTNSQFKLDGVVVRDSQDNNFDVGPIVIQGNIFYDAALALLTGLGVDTSNLEQVFPRSPIDQIDNAIQDSLQGARAVAGTSAENDLGRLLAQSVLGGDELASRELLEALAAGGSPGSGQSEHAETPLQIPEPGTLMLVGLGATSLWYRRRR
jgi:hypothetical protein